MRETDSIRENSLLYYLNNTHTCNPFYCGLPATLVCVICPYEEFERPSISPGDPAMLATLLSDCCSGGCNVLHSLALLGRPPDPSHSHGEKKGLSSSARTTPRRGVIREIMKQAMSIAGGIPPQPATGRFWYCTASLNSDNYTS